MSSSATLNVLGTAGAVTGSLAGVTFRFQADAPDLQTYARTHLANVMGAGAALPKVDASLRWHEERLTDERIGGISGQVDVTSDYQTLPGPLPRRGKPRMDRIYGRPEGLE